jgi:zinc transport system ATP-binding protein
MPDGTGMGLLLEIKTPDSPLLFVKDVSVRRNKADVIKDVNLKIYPGEFVGIVGPNGGGKSTLIQTILGVLKHHSGGILLSGHEPLSQGVFGKVAWVSQAAANLPKNVRLTVRELVSLGVLNHKNWWNWFLPNRASLKIEDAIEMVGLSHLAHRDVNQLSGGERQRAVIARALASEADLLLLDEPLVGMDRASRSSLLKLLDRFCHEQNKTIVMISHDIGAMLQTAHRMVYLEETIWFDGPPANFPSLEELALMRGIEDVHGACEQCDDDVPSVLEVE